MAPRGKAGDGSFSHPFILADGSEYEFNRLVRPWLDRGINVEVIFSDGVYMIVLDSAIRDSSGALLKFGFYPLVENRRIVHEYPAGIADRRMFFIGNVFSQNKAFERYKHAAFSSDVMSFIHDNSVEEQSGKISAPEAGAVFINNAFRLGGEPALAKSVSFLRVEAPDASYRPDFPGWVFENNTVSGVAPERMVVARVRGGPFSLSSAVKTSDYDRRFHLAEQTGDHHELDPRGVDRAIEELMATSLRSSDTARDELIRSIISQKGIPGLDLSR